MTHNRLLDEMLHDNNEKGIVKRYSVKTIIISFLTLLLGLACIFLFMHLTPSNANHGSRYWGLIILSIFFIAGGVGGLIWGPKNYVYKPMNSPLTSYSLYFTGESADVIIKAINRQDFELLRSLKNSHESGLLLDMISTDEFQYNQYRLYRYSSYRFEPITDIMSMNSKTAQYLAGITH